MSRRHFPTRAASFPARAVSAVITDASLAVSGALALGAMALGVPAFGSAHAAALAVPPTEERSVSYLRYRVEVPASWPVISLATARSACVRFDQHAVYLGTPTPMQRCPAHLIRAKTEALLIEPLSARHHTSGTTASRVAHEYVVTDAAAGVQVTATYGTDRVLIDNILRRAATSPGALTWEAGQTARQFLAAPAARATARSGLPDPALTRPALLPISATNGTGRGFDTCTAPSAATMNAWMSHSRYRAVGIYIGGSDRACAQPNLTADWVSRQAAAGWHFIPLYVGPQAERGEITAPARQGTSAADDAVVQARALGFRAGAPVYYDMEAYPRRQSARALAFLSAWTNELHRRGYASGIYSSSASGVTDLVNHYGNPGYATPDVLFDALWNGDADTNDPAIPPGYWAHHQRLHQYSGGTKQTFGGRSLEVDRDYLDVLLSRRPGGLVPDAAAPLSGREGLFLLH